MTKKNFLSFLFILSVLIFPGCGKQKNDTVINIGYFNNITHAQALLMKADNSLQDARKDDVTVVWHAFNAGPAEVEALFSGSIDIGYIGPVPAITANVKSNGDIKILTAASKGGASLVVAGDSDIHTMADLDGKTIAIPQIGNTQHLNLLALLEEYGYQTTENGGTVTVVAVDNADVANTMNRRDIDAALVPEPWASTLLSSGCRILLGADEIMGGNYDVAVVVVRTDFLEKHPDLVAIFLEQHDLATDHINTNTENALSQINSLLLQDTGKNLEESVLRDAFSRLYISTALNKDSILQFCELSLANHFINAIPDEDDLYVSGD